MRERFDVLVVGAGSAGCVVASRLSEDAACSVGLIEAGGMPDDPDIADPAKWTALPGRAFDWAYRTVPQPFTANRVHDWPRGRLVGGSSCLHAMAYVRGHPSDFEPWRAAGGDRWSYEGLLAGFRRSEAVIDAATGSREGDGPLDVYLPTEQVNPVVRAYMAAGNALGVPRIESHNGPELIGTCANALNIRKGRRLSVADAYLPEEVLQRPNLTLLTDHLVERIVVDGSRARVLEVVADNRRRQLHADRVVLCAGAIESPLLLMRSGIGNKDVLSDVGIDVTVERNGVGANLQDHLLVMGNVYRSARKIPPSRLQHSESLMYLDSTDLAATSGRPDIVLACVVAPSAAEGFHIPEYGQAFTILCGITHPTSRGRILPSGPRLSDPPIIDPEYLSTEQDRATLRAALRTARMIGAHPALDEWRDAEVLPGPQKSSDADLDAFIAQTVSTHHHPAGTCRMGNEDDAVVDAELRLKELENLFVVDASVMPTLPSGPINASTVALAETWSALDPK
ncbi:GMC family oxidoreductase [Nitratireductor sp. GCM10026969]|uniref:GMC family oxidoreductase n=1 Tax=Nitratireductor sp. GCM10026969 TaxID=3252645 RepID=UPI00361E7A98